MRDSFSPRQGTTTTTTTNMISSGRNQQHRPPFSPTNPRNVDTNHRGQSTNNHSSSSGDLYPFDNHHNSSDIHDPWKVTNHNSNKFSASSKLVPPNPEGRIPIPRVSSLPSTSYSSSNSNSMMNQSRPLSRGRLMEGPTIPIPTAAKNHTSKNNIDVWDISDHQSPWFTSPGKNGNQHRNAEFDDDTSTWFGTTTTKPNLKDNRNKNIVTDQTNVEPFKLSSPPSSPFQWGRRSRSNNDVELVNHNDNKYDRNGNDVGFAKSLSIDSSDKSLYDDSGEKITSVKKSHRNNHTNQNHHRMNTSSPKVKSSISTFTPLGSPSRPIVATTSPSPIVNTSKVLEKDGSVNRPIAIHDCSVVVDSSSYVLDEREKDLLSNAARKKNVSLSKEQRMTKNSMHTEDQNDNIRDSDILQKAKTKRRQQHQQNATTNSHTLPNSKTNDTTVADFNDIGTTLDYPNNKVQQQSQPSTLKQNKGMFMGFFRGNKRGNNKKKTKVVNGTTIESPMSQSSRMSDTQNHNVNVDATPAITSYSSKRPSPLNIWTSSSSNNDKIRISNRSKSPANLWTALSDNSDDTDPNWNTSSDKNTKNQHIKTKSANVDENNKTVHLPAVTTPTTMSSEKPLKSDITFGHSIVLGSDGGHEIGYNETNDDGTTVSGVTNPSYLPEEKTTSNKKTWSVKAPSLMSTSGEDSFNVNSPIFTSGRIVSRIAPSPRDKVTSTLATLSDDDFSDPFFPGGIDDVAKEESGISEAPDPELEHVAIGSDNEETTDDDHNHRKGIEERRSKSRHKRSVARKAVVAKVNDVKEKSQVDILPAKLVSTNAKEAVAIKDVPSHVLRGDTIINKARDRTRHVPSKRNVQKRTIVPIASNVSQMDVKTDDAITPKTMVSTRISAIETKASKPPPSHIQGKRGSPYRRANLRTSKVATLPVSNLPPPNVILSSSNIPPLVVTNSIKNKNNAQEKMNVVLSKTSTDSEPRVVSGDDFSNEKRLNRSSDLSLSSVGSDIQRLRSILRRSRIQQGNSDQIRYIEPLESAFATYDERKINDPMQRAGLRLLSAAVVPIQSAIRRHLAFRQALTRMWAIVTIQAATRQWLVRYDDFRWAIIKLQSYYRGGRVRDQILLEHCCAIEIQRHVRGLIASWYVYGEIHKIKLVQACVRRRLAMEQAMDRMVSIIQIQSIARGFLVRKRQTRLVTAVTHVQAAWRAFCCRFSYQLDILDIIIVQSVWRKAIAKIKYHRLLFENQVRCAVKIQSQWRSYDCSMNYLHYIADVLIVQSIMRRYMAIKRCNAIRTDNALIIQMAVRVFLAKLVLERIKSAILIQSAYRGFVCYADYMFTISDIVLAQSVARRWIKQKDYPKLLHDYRSNAAITVQKHWRGFAQVTKYHVMCQENRAAVLIQSAWRRFVHFSMFIVIIDSVIRIQSTCRGFMIRADYVEKNEAAVAIQCAYRVAIAKNRASRLLTAHKLFNVSEQIGIDQRHAAVDIQRVIRGAQVRDAVGLYTRTRIFQSAWRGYVARKLYNRQLKARCIQSMWRRHVALVDFDVYKKARLIQTAWRRYVASSTFALYIKVRAIQTVWRGYAARSSYNIYRNARCIQTMWRGYAARSSYIVFIQARTIQSAWRQHSARQDLYQHRTTRKIQALWRGYVLRNTVLLYLKARLIQAAWRGHLVKLPYNEYIASRRIQSAWRRSLATKCLDRHREARRLQTWYRGLSQRRVFEAQKQYNAARRVQAAWRCKSISSAFKSYLAARRIQTAWRGTSISRAYKHFMNVRLLQALWRGRVVRIAYNQLTSARRIQAIWRGRTICIAYRHYIAARRVQKVWRGYVVNMAYRKYRSASRLQAVWRGRLICRAYQEFLMARRIQSFWRCRSLCMAHNQYLIDRKARYATFYSVCRVQALWRQKCLETAFKQYLAAIRIQTFWRAMSVCNAYEMYRVNRMNQRIQFEAAQTIQSRWRCWTLSCSYKLFKGARSARYAHHTSALRIQTSWRSASLHKAFTQYISARNIQACWRRKLIRTAYLQFKACRRIQATWRCKLIKTAYWQYLASRSIQAIWRQKLLMGDSAQTAEAERAQLQSLMLKRRQSAATIIAATWRCFSACQQYWHILGSIIEIQTVVRGWIARRRLKVLLESALVQLRTANAIKYNSLARSRNSRLQLNENRGAGRSSLTVDKKTIHWAARTIQRFFLFVKAEVDREIRAEKKRRKVKKKVKKKRDSFDERILESAWRKTIEEDLQHVEHVRRAPPRATSKETLPKLLTKGSEDSRLSTGREVIFTPMSASGRLGVVPLSVNSFGFDLDVSCGGISTHSKPNKSRFHSMSSREIDDDSLLEEAWIDSKINCAKERRSRVMDQHSSIRSSMGKTRLTGPVESTLPPVIPSPARRIAKDVNSDRRPPRRAQAV
jgi:hypothetical protein